jgi:hypothetical protein
MSQNHLDTLTVDDLQSYFSDFHKDFYGFRPRFATPEQWRDAEWLKSSIIAIHDTMDHMKTTPSGRAELRSQGWVIEESDFDVLEQAEELANADSESYGEKL